MNNTPPDTTDAFIGLILDLSQMATDVPAIRKHPLFLKWFEGPPKMALYEQVLGYGQAGEVKESDLANT